jgi:hypothetical protein
VLLNVALFSEYYGDFYLWDGQFELARASLFLSAGLALLYNQYKNRSWSTLIFIPSLTYFCFIPSTVGTLFSNDAFSTIQIYTILMLFSGFPLFLFSPYLMFKGDKEHEYRDFIIIYLLFCLFFVFAGMGQLIFGEIPGGRLTAWSMSAIKMGELSAIIIFTSSALFLSRSYISYDWAILCIIGLASIVLYGTGSRGSIISLIFCLIPLSLFYLKQGHPVRLASLTGVGLIMFGICFFEFIDIPDEASRRLKYSIRVVLFGAEPDPTAQSRIDMTSVVIKDIWSNFTLVELLFGGGIGRFSNLNFIYEVGGYQIGTLHNMILSILHQFGIFACLGILGLLLSPLYLIGNNFSDLTNQIVFGILVLSFSTYFFTHPFIGAHVFLFFSGMIIMREYYSRSGKKRVGNDQKQMTEGGTL